MSTGIDFHNPLELDDTPITPEVQPKEVVEPVVEPIDINEEPVTIEDQEIVPEPDNIDYSSIANHLSEKGHIHHVPEDIKLDEFGGEDFDKLIAANFEHVGNAKFKEGADFANKQLVDKIHPTINKLLKYNLDNPNVDESDINSLIGAMLTQNDVTNLTVENDAERIVKEFYKSLDWDSKDIEDKIINLTESGGMDKEATLLKPKLDAKAASIAQAKFVESEKIKEYETNLQTTLEGRVVTLLDQGSLNGIPLTNEERQFLYAATMNNDTPVNLGGKKVHMGFAEALVRDAKYNPKKELDNLMLGLLVIQGGQKAIEKFYKQKATTEAVETFVKEHKFSNSKKKSSGSAPIHDDVDTGISFNI